MVQPQSSQPYILPEHEGANVAERVHGVRRMARLENNMLGPMQFYSKSVLFSSSTLPRMSSDNPEDELKVKKVIPLDEDDIALLKTYVRASLSAREFDEKNVAR